MSRSVAKAAVSTPVHSPLVGTPNCDVTASLTDLAEDLLAEGGLSKGTAQQALQQLRRRMHASEATLWEIANGSAREVLYAGLRPHSPTSIVAFGSDSMSIERLRRTGIVVCRLGAVSGVEELAPAGLGSFVVAAATDRGTISGALVLGWANTMPRCDETALRRLRVVAGLLARTAHRPSDASEGSAVADATLADAILGSLPQRIAIVNRDGIIVRANVAWIDFARQQGVDSPEAIGPGMNLLEVYRTAAANGCTDAAEALSGIEAVCRGNTGFFETTYASHSPSEERWSTLTVTPLRDQEGTAIISHSDINRHWVVDLARRNSQELFHRLADSLPLPLWMLAPDGRLLYVNQRWLQAAAGPNGDGHEPFEWTKAFHAADRTRAVSAFRSAVSGRKEFHIELRLNATDGTYRWSTCVGAPHYASDGRLESVVVLCCDSSAKRHAELALKKLASKLVLAQEHEWSRIARELHDDLGQQVALLVSKLDLAARHDGVRNRVRAGLTEARQSLQNLATSVHNLSHELHPAKLTLLGLERTLESLCRNVSAESGVAIAFDRSEIPPDVPEESALCVFRVAQEALHNVVKHSKAQSVVVKVGWTHSQLTLQITDDGAGFDPLASQSAGLGLLTMRERVELLRGKLTIETAQGRGTTIDVALPVPHRGGTPTVNRRSNRSDAGRELAGIGGPDSAA